MQNVLDFAKSPSRRLSTAIEFAKATTQPLNLQTHKIRVELIMNGYTVFEKIHEYLLGLGALRHVTPENESSSQRHSACLLFSYL
jgi:hypothetical protein